MIQASLFLLIPEMTRILIVDDQASFRQQLRQLLNVAGLDTVAEAGDIPTAVELCSNLLPDLAIVDVILPGISGLEGVPLLKNAAPGLRVFLVSAHRDQAHVFQVAALQAGAEAFISKDDLEFDLVSQWKNL